MLTLAHILHALLIMQDAHSKSWINHFIVTSYVVWNSQSFYQRGLLCFVTKKPHVVNSPPLDFQNKRGETMLINIVHDENHSYVSVLFISFGEGFISLRYILEAARSIYRAI